MRPRQTLTELFSTFLQFEGDRFRAWISDPRLRRSIEQRVNRAKSEQEKSELSENYWALYWHKSWHTSLQAQSASLATSLATSLAREHLVAYMQESCYWAAQKTSINFTNTQYTLADCFQMAIVQIDKILKGFNAQQGFSFKNYASVTLSSLIRESLRQQQAIDICTDWALLRKLSQKRLSEALQNVGLAPDTIASYLLAWNCFKMLYIPQQATATRKLSRPDRPTWDAITAAYNRDRTTPSNLPSATPETLEKWLLNCAKAARSYLYPNTISINTPKSGENSGEFIDDLAETQQTDSLLSELIQIEEVQTRQTQHSQINALLIQALTQLDDPSRSLIQFYYRDNLTQQQMAERLNIKQYTVSRRLTKARETLLITLAKWSQETLHIPPTTDLLKHTSTALEEWLTQHFQV